MAGTQDQEIDVVASRLVAEAQVRGDKAQKVLYELNKKEINDEK